MIWAGKVLCWSQIWSFHTLPVWNFAKYFRSDHFQHKVSECGCWFQKIMHNKKKVETCTQKKWETCLIWSFLAKMERWQDVTSLSWVQLMLEIKHHKAMIACLSCLSRSVDPLVDRQWLWHCCEELLVLEMEEEWHWLVAALWKSRLRPHPAWTLQEPNWINRSPDPAHPPTRSLQEHQ